MDTIEERNKKLMKEINQKLEDGIKQLDNVIEKANKALEYSNEKKKPPLNK